VHVRARVGAVSLAPLALLVTVGYHVRAVPQVPAEGAPPEVGGAVRLVRWALAGLTPLPAVRAAVGLLPRRRAYTSTKVGATCRHR
jgi:hypothetical protein